MATATTCFAAKDFSKAVRKSLARKGMRVVGIQMLPDYSSSMPMANAIRGYVVDDRGPIHPNTTTGHAHAPDSDPHHALQGL
jgi:hypothetical protein